MSLPSLTKTFRFFFVYNSRREKDKSTSESVIEDTNLIKIRYHHLASLQGVRTLSTRLTVFVV